MKNPKNMKLHPIGEKKLKKYQIFSIIIFCIDIGLITFLPSFKLILNSNNRVFKPKFLSKTLNQVSIGRPI